MPVKKSTAEALRAAMQRLLGGKPLHTDGSLIWNNVWREAGVSRATAGRAEDIIEEWKTKLRERAADGNVEPTPTEAIRELERKLEEKARASKETNEALRGTIRVMANHIQALTLALRQKEAIIEQLTADLAKAGVSSTVTPFQGRT